MPTPRSENATRNAKIEAMWSTGISASKIGKQLGITRNAVIGHVDRHLPKRPKWHPGRQEPVGCRFIAGDPAEQGWFFCQKVTAPGRPYCEKHAAQCYLVVEPLNAA